MLNHTGTAIWQMLEQATSRDAIVSRLHAEYDDVGRDEIAADVDRFLANVMQRAFVSETRDERDE
jgi:hypothetical protein